MSLLSWLGLVLLSCTWLFNAGMYLAAGASWWIALLVGGTACYAAAWARRELPLSFSARESLLAVPLLLFIAIVPFPYSLGAWVLLAGVLATLVCLRLPSLACVPCGLMVSGAILLVQSPLVYLYGTLTAYSHYFYWLDPLLKRIFEFLGLQVSYSQGAFYILTITNLYDFPTTWEKLGGFVFFAVLAGSLPLLYLVCESGRRGRTYLRLLAAGLAYLVVRYGFLIILFLYLMTFVKYKEEVCRMDVFWDVRIMLLSFLPLAYLLCRLVPLRFRQSGEHGSAPAAGMPWRSLACFVLGAIFVAGMFGFQDPGAAKQGRVILDERHSGWEKSTRKMDTEWYGDESGYNFYWMAEYINHYFPLARNFSDITPEVLANCDILILKNPTSAYTPAEITAITDFVHRGGGLYLMSEHTNVFGNSTYINPLAKAFGFAFRYDVIFDINRKFEQVYEAPQLLPHPVVQHMPYFCFKVSCSIQPMSAECESIILSTALKAQDIYYPAGNFYPAVKDHTYMPFGNFLQMVGIKAGTGRVIGFSDSTSYSNFEAFIAGKPELLLGALTWLNRANRFAWLNTFFLVLAVLCCGLGSRIFSRQQASGVQYLWLVVFIAAGIAVGLGLCQALARSAYGVPQPMTPYTRVVFEQQHGDYELPLKGFTKDRERSYEVFYQWVLRVGYYPFTGRTLPQDLQDAHILVIINPVKTFLPDELAGIKAFLEKGGRVLLLESLTNQNSTADQLLAPCGLKVRRERITALPAQFLSPWMHASGLGRALAIEGGEAHLKSEQGEAVLASARVGQGLIAVLSCGQIFTNPPMGSSYRVVPDAQQRQIYNLQFNILKGLMQGDLKAFF